MTESDLSMKDKLDFMRQLGQMMELIKETRPQLRRLVQTMVGQADGSNGGAWFTVLAQISDASEDDVIGMLMISIATMAKLRVAIKDTAMEKELAEILGLGEPEGK